MYRLSPLLRHLPALILTFTLSLSAAAQQSDASRYLTEIESLAQQALEASRRAQRASSVLELKREADAVYQTIWGIPSGLAAENARGAEAVHGWKTRWQVTYTDFDPKFAERYGSAPPEITDPARLGIVGRGRHVRKQIESLLAEGSPPDALATHADHIVTSLNNVIGWMKMDDGVTKGERQPRVDLTREWDAPVEFWMSTADTGWLHEVYAQALNILKTDYDGDLQAAKQHAGAMTQLIEKAINGVDADNSGSVEPVRMEGGIATAVQHAHLGGILSH